MRQFLLLLFIILFQVHSQGQNLPDEVRLSYTCYNKPLDVVLKELSERSGIDISYSSRRINSRRKVNVNARNESLGTILTVIFSGTQLNYEIIGDQIVVFRINSLSRRSTGDPVISGYITDANNNEPLIGANIYLSDNSKGTITNDHGFYSIQLRRGTFRFEFSYVGYGREFRQFYLGGDTTINLSLQPEALLNDVLISDSQSTSRRENSYAEEILTIDELTSMVSLGGETDALRLSALLPGVTTGADGLGGINVRGGSSDQNLVLFDGVPIYNPGHALGIYSIFNSAIVKNVSMLKGSFPSRYGGRLSSIIDVRTREGSTNDFHGEVGLSTLAAKAYLEGPIGGKHSFIFSARRTFLDPWLKEVSKYLNEQNGDEGFANYSFYDLNGKLTFNFSDQTKLLLAGYKGADHFFNNVNSFEEEQAETIEKVDQIDWGWGNSMYYARLNHQFSSKIFSSILGYYTDYYFDSYEYDRFLSTTDFGRIFDFKADFFSSRIRDVGVRFDVDYYLNWKHRIKAGGGFVRHLFNPGLVQVSENDRLTSFGEDVSQELVESLVDRPNLVGNELSMYIEDEFTAGEGIVINGGVHTTYVNTGGNNYLSVQPRLSFVTQSDDIYFKAGISNMYQYLHLLSSSGLGLPSDVWLPSTDNIDPSSAWIYDAEIGFKTSHGLIMGVGGFYKRLKNIVSYSEGSATLISNEVEWEIEIPEGEGISYGAEFFLNKRIGRTTWFSNYTFSQSSRQFVDLNLGREFPFKFDRRHNFKVSLIHRITENAEFSMNWNYASGTPYSAPESYALTANPDGTLDFNFIYEQKNNTYLPDYHRLDVAFNLYSDYGWGKQRISIGVYNLMNKRNPYYVDIDNVDGRIGAFQARQFSVFPIFPSISYSLSF